MPEIKRRAKKSPPQTETPPSPPRQTRVTLTKDVSSRYRKLVPRAKAVDSAAQRRRNSPSEALKTLIQRDLPEALRQIRETQDLLRAAAEEILTLLETWDRKNTAPSEPDHQAPLITSLFEKMSFQDLAGQRLAKVENFLKTLREIQPSPRLQGTRSKTLKGPQAAGGGLNQQEVEALLKRPRENRPRPQKANQKTKGPFGRRTEKKTGF
ncbi:MAG: hypothetical protein FWG97_03820 [Deltaproteobacteria bacterium]|nr:hypothetical protein [Deltaproteobacteria bacterium]